MIRPGEKTKFFFSNLFKGLAWFAVLIGVFLVFRKYVDPDFEKMLEPLFNNHLLIISIFCISEVVIGIIPPPLFMIWALRTGNLADYSLLLLMFAVLSYAAGFIGYLFGSFLNSTVIFRFLRKRYLGKYQVLLQKYGAFLILVAALTPVPFSAVSMMVGSSNYPAKSYLIWAASRFAMFAVYGVIVWEAGMV